MITIMPTKTQKFGKREELFKYIGIKGKSVAEIGVHIGKFSAFLYQQWPASLLLIDPWAEGPDPMASREFSPQSVFDERYEIVKKKFADADNVRIQRATSIAAAATVYDNTLDVVLIDGNHEFMFALTDIVLWYLKLKPGGWLAIHDYNYKDPWCAGVVRAYSVMKRLFPDLETIVTRERNATVAVRKP